MDVDPQVAGLFVGGLEPSTPDINVQPVPGDTSQLFLVVLLQFPKLSTVVPLMEVLVNVTLVFRQTMVSGITVIFALGFCPMDGVPGPE